MACKVNVAARAFFCVVAKLANITNCFEKSVWNTPSLARSSGVLTPCSPPNLFYVSSPNSQTSRIVLNKVFGKLILGPAREIVNCHRPAWKLYVFKFAIFKCHRQIDKNPKSFWTVCLEYSSPDHLEKCTTGGPVRKLDILSLVIFTCQRQTRKKQVFSSEVLGGFLLRPLRKQKLKWWAPACELDGSKDDK